MRLALSPFSLLLAGSNTALASHPPHLHLHSHHPHSPLLTACALMPTPGPRLHSPLRISCFLPFHSDDFPHHNIPLIHTDAQGRYQRHQEGPGQARQEGPQRPQAVSHHLVRRMRLADMASPPDAFPLPLSHPRCRSRALSAYMFFVQDHRARVIADNPDVSFGEVGKLLGAKWKELTPSEKKVTPRIA